MKRAQGRHVCAHASTRPRDSRGVGSLRSHALQIPRLGHLTAWRCRGYLPSVKTRFGANSIPLGLALALLTAGPVTLAQTAPNGDELLGQIAILEKPANQAALLKQPLDSARAALNRARDARAAGDVEHGIELEALALDYITIARDVLRATDLEKALNQSQTELIKTETARRQTETLLEATIAQRERTKALLLQSHAERDAKKSVPASTKTKGEGAKAAINRTDGESAKPAAPKVNREGIKSEPSKINKTDGTNNKADGSKTEPSKANQGEKK